MNTSALGEPTHACMERPSAVQLLKKFGDGARVDIVVRGCRLPAAVHAAPRAACLDARLVGVCRVFRVLTTGPSQDSRCLWTPNLPSPAAIATQRLPVHSSCCAALLCRRRCPRPLGWCARAWRPTTPTQRSVGPTGGATGWAGEGRSTVGQGNYGAPATPLAP